MVGNGGLILEIPRGRRSTTRAIAPPFPLFGHLKNRSMGSESLGLFGRKTVNNMFPTNMLAFSSAVLCYKHEIFHGHRGDTGRDLDGRIHSTLGHGLSSLRRRGRRLGLYSSIYKGVFVFYTGSVFWTRR